MQYKEKRAHHWKSDMKYSNKFKEAFEEEVTKMWRKIYIVKAEIKHLKENSWKSQSCSHESCRCASLGIKSKRRLDN